jgi:cell division septation protein DedD
MSDDRNSANNQDRLSAERDVPPWLQPVPEDEAPQGMFAAKKMWIMAGVAVTVVALFVAVIVALYDGGAGEPARHITADTSPIREKPQEPGGMDVPYQDKQVFERASGDTMPSGEVTLAPEAEEPVESLPVEEEASSDPIGDIAEEVTEQAQTKTQAPAPQPEVKKTEAAPVKTEEKPAEKPAPAKTTAKAKGYLVQLGAYGSEETAEKAWRAIRGKYGNFLSGLTPSYEAVQSGGRTLYRLRVGPLDTRAAADEVCLGLRAQQQACIVVNP